VQKSVTIRLGRAQAPAVPKQARLDAPGTLHHVMAHGIERRNIFLGQRDYGDFLRRVEEAVGPPRGQR
jgi:hypothetical protein